MRRLLPILQLILLLAGCHALRMTGGDPRPEVLVHGRPLRAAMINPKPPEYGIDQIGGCIVQGEFRVEITQLALDGSGTLWMKGVVAHTQTRQGQPAVRIAHMRGDSTAGVVYSGRNGDFDLVAERADGAMLVLSQIGYRTLQLDLNRLARAATPSS